MIRVGVFLCIMGYSCIGNMAPALIVGPYQKSLTVQFSCYSAGRYYDVEVEVGYPRNATATPLPYSLDYPEVRCRRVTKEEVPWKVIESYNFGRAP